jgi:hypothetical protein
MYQVREVQFVPLPKDTSAQASADPSGRAARSTPRREGKDDGTLEEAGSAADGNAEQADPEGNKGSRFGRQATISRQFFAGQQRPGACPGQNFFEAFLLAAVYNQLHKCGIGCTDYIPNAVEGSIIPKDFH